MPRLLCFLIFVSSMAQSQNYRLAWSEEFDQPALNTETWNFEEGFSWNNEKQFYTGREKNLRVENGLLVIEAHRERFENARYTSARINTLGKQQFRYGRIEVRAKLPEGAGTWPAIWMLGTNHITDGYPACGEIDIMEFVGKNPGEIHGSLHYPETDNVKMNSVTESFRLPASERGFHTYAIEWDGAKISFFVDDMEYQVFRLDDANRPGRANIYRKPFYLVLNLALGGKWAGKIDKKIFPARFYVDYVRYYQLQDPEEGR